MFFCRYINKNFAQLISETPYTVRLNFEPSGRSVGEVGLYYQEPKLNQCVVCGKNDSFIRKNVVPREYRKFFPRKCINIYFLLMQFSI